MILLRWESVKKFKNLIKPIQIWRRKPWKIRWISIKSLEKPNQIKLTDWLTNRPIDRATDQPNDRATERPTERPTDWPSDRLTNPPTHWLIEWLSDRATDQPTNRLSDWATEQPIERPSDWPTNRRTDWLTYELNDDLYKEDSKKSYMERMWDEINLDLIISQKKYFRE